MDYGWTPAKPGVAPSQEPWVKPETHSAAIRPGGTYLPGITQEKTPRYNKKGEKIGTTAVSPPAFDLVVVARPLTVECLDKQPGRKLIPAKLPRSLIKSLPWPSDHTSVVAVVRAMGVERGLRVATWNVAAPWYFAKFWPDAAFGFDKSEEKSRQEAIERHVQQLLAVSDVLGLQEVPVELVAPLMTYGVAQGFQVQWVAAPSDKDDKLYDKAVGKRGCTASSDAAAASDEPLEVEELPLELPQTRPVPHDMLFARLTVLSAAWKDRQSRTRPEAPPTAAPSAAAPAATSCSGGSAAVDISDVGGA